MEWISVEERLPDEYGRYLVWCPNLLYEEYIDTYLGADRTDKLWSGFAGTQATHWMPLPPPPEIETPDESRG